MQPIVKPLSNRHRNFVFLALIIIFVISLPAFIFYSVGYRYNFFAEEPIVTATGGLYIASTATDSQIFLNEKEVVNARVFRKALYLQGIEPGVHRVHVQADGLHTWVKDLMVYPQIVTEAESFNLPLVPRVRPVTEYVSSKNEPVYFSMATSTFDLFAKASNSVPIILSTSSATSTVHNNPEFLLLVEMFEEKASTTARRIVLEEVEKTNKFGFATVTPEVKIDEEQATSTVVQDRIMLYKQGEDIFAQALGTGRQVPHYFCTTQLSTTSKDALELMSGLDNDYFETDILDVSNENLCRSDILINRQGEKVHDFNFFPGNTNLVLMRLDSGLYVVEIDDRAWQNTQLLYGGEDIEMLIYGNNIFLRDNGFIFEVLPAIIGR